MSAAPAKLVGIAQGIQVNCPAHFAIVDLDATWTVDQNQLFHRNPLTPYHGVQLQGTVVETFVHGDSLGDAQGRIL